MENPQAPLGYFRYPTISGDRVVFVSEDDLWEVSRLGGVARRLTAGLGSVGRPWLSPNGQYIAYIGKEEGDSEVYVIPGQGGEVRRLTHLGATVTVAGWSADNERVVFASNYGRPFRNWYELFEVDLEGHEPRRLPYGLAQNISRGPGGRVVLGRNTTDPARWKRYRGGTRGYLWIDAQGNGDFHRFDGPDGNYACPMWLRDRIYFLSDFEGVANLYSILPDGRDLTRHSDHADYYARNAASDGRRIVYHAGGDIFVFDPEADRVEPVKIQYFSQRTEREKRFVSAESFLTGYRLDRPGKQVLITTRGKLFAMRPFEGPVTPLGITQGVRYRLAHWMPEQETILAVSDEGGEEGLEQIPLDPLKNRVRLPGDIGRPLELEVSPDGKWAALANHRQEMLLMDLANQSLSVVERSEFGTIGGLSWSPDSRWLAYSFPDSSKTTAIRLYALEEGRAHAVTRPVLRDVSPVFDPKGRYLYFLSYRTFDPVYDNLRFDLGFPNGMRPYCIPLSKDLPSPFLPGANPPKEPKPEVKSDAKEKEEPIPTVTVDLDGIADRVLAFPVDEGRYQKIRATAEKVFYTVVEPEGSLDSSFYPGAPPAKATLKSYHLENLKEETVGSNVTSFELSGDGTQMIVRARNSLRVVKTGEQWDEKKTRPGRDSGIIDPARISVEVVPPIEWAQMQREAWRLMRDNFWDAGMSGVDWDDVYLRYQALLVRIATRSEFSDIMWEMQGELGTSHAYEMGGDYLPEPHHRIGHLGADFTWDAERDGWRIERIVAGDTWQEGQDSPLRSPGVNLVAGDLLLAIDGQPLSALVSPGMALVNREKAEVALAVERGDKTRDRVVVKTLDSELPARYRDWVEQNRRRVHEASAGRLGYLHIPDMGPRGYAEFYRGYLVENERDGLIVDVRFNGGGHVSQLILENLARKRIGYDITRWGKPEPYPGESVIGPIVALTNEFAGSDGDIFSHSFKLMGLGPLIGMRTWGGVIGIWARHPLVDGTVTTQPEFSFWFVDVGFGVENYGTDPDIPVDITPADYRAGRDPQLERALEEATAALAKNPPRLPDFGEHPSRKIPPLPPRG